MKKKLSSSVAWMYPFWYFTTVVKVGSKKNQDSGVWTGPWTGLWTQ